MKIIRFEIQPDELENVERVIDVKTTQTFDDLHRAIAEAFNIKVSRGASFYTSNSKWQKLNEITLGKESRFENPVDGLKTKVEKVMEDTQRFIYNTEDAPQFTFLMLAGTAESKADPKKFPRIVSANGNLPNMSRPKKFTDNIFADDFKSQTGEVFDESETDLLNPPDTP